MRRRTFNLVPRIAHDDAAASAAEFALVAPLLILFLFGIIDVGRFMWEWNTAEKATQMGVRFAVVTDIVPSDLVDYDFTTVAGVIQGAPVSDELFPGVSCTGTEDSASCTCNKEDSCDFDLGGDKDAFNNIVDRVSQIYGRVNPENVVIDYGPSGLGFAGNPYGSDVAPIVTVRLQGIQFQPILGQIFGATINIEGFASSMTMEDGAGFESN